LQLFSGNKNPKKLNPMTDTNQALEALMRTFEAAPVTGIHKIPQSGSDRTYYRITTPGTSYIAAVSANVKENETFLYFSEHFRRYRCPIPQVYAISPDRTCYIQEDFGDNSLLSVLESRGTCESVFELFKQSLSELAKMQILGDEGLDYEQCITSKSFGKKAIVSDFLYFKYYFLDTLKIPYDKEKLMDDFEALATYLSHVDHTHFMFRDFQSRNILVKDEKVHFIDYQGGMKGALQYDVASLLWQAKAELSESWKNRLLKYYMDCVEATLGKPLDRQRFTSQYNGYVLIRLLQVLGAYGFRGLFERKAHFLTSIPIALKNIRWFLSHLKTGISLPEFDRLLQLITSDEVIARFEPVKAGPADPLVVTINSFSYLANGYPPDESKNGGGFVFDCRGILNPGRIQQYKTQTGKEKPVIDFLEQETKMPEFLNSVYSIVDISVNDYLKRNFASLMINFGCTGGQHRSVFAAEATARHLRNKFGVAVRVNHLNAANWVREIPESPGPASST
jgi:aminoglycoside/choline kinase family phosphotransferase